VTVAWVVVGAAAAGAATAAIVGAVWMRLRYTRRMAFFRCRIGPPVVPWRRRARWRIGRRRAAWVGNVLLVPSGVLRMFLTPFTTGMPRTAALRLLEPEQARGLGLHPVAMQLMSDDGRLLEIAVSQSSADEVVGPFLVAALPELPQAPREPGG
jgi:hypothetical protein